LPEGPCDRVFLQRRSCVSLSDPSFQVTNSPVEGARSPTRTARTAASVFRLNGSPTPQRWVVRPPRFTPQAPATGGHRAAPRNGAVGAGAQDPSSLPTQGAGGDGGEGFTPEQNARANQVYAPGCLLVVGFTLWPFKPSEPEKKGEGKNQGHLLTLFFPGQTCALFVPVLFFEAGVYHLFRAAA